MAKLPRAGFAFAASACLTALAGYSQAGASRDPASDAFVLLPERASSAYVDATATHVPLEPSLHATDSVLIDVDRDGDLDVVISVEYGVNCLYVNDGRGRLTYKPDAFGTAIHDSEHVRAADFNGDGNMDVIFVAETDEAHQLFLGDGRGGFTNASDRLPASTQGNGPAVGDVNGDGLPNIFVGSTGEVDHGRSVVSARNLLFLNDRSRPGHFILDRATSSMPRKSICRCRMTRRREWPSQTWMVMATLTRSCQARRMRTGCSSTTERAASRTSPGASN
jgi:hypothetical protein